MKTAFILIISFFIFCSCSNNHGKHSNDVLRVALGNEPDTLDPQYINGDTAANRVAYDLFAGLMDFNQENEIIPGLAKSFEISKDGLNYTFHLREKLHFSNGLPLTAHDFVYSWERLINPRFDIPGSHFLNNVVNADKIMHGQLSVEELGVEAPNNNTFIVHLIHPDKNFIKTCAKVNLMVVPEAIISRYGKAWTHPRHIATSGAYLLRQHVLNGYILVQKNPRYWDANNVKIDQVKFVPYIDVNTALDAYKTGEIDVTNVPINSMRNLIEKNKKEVHIVKEEGIYNLDFNFKLPIFYNNIKLRQALSMAVDREILVNNVLQQKQEPLYSLVTPTIDNGKYANLEYSWRTLSRRDRIAAAKILYQDAGFSSKNPLYLTLNFNENDLNKKIMLAVASMWQNNLGIRVTLKSQGWNIFLNERRNGKFMVTRDVSIPDDDNVSTYLEAYTCNSAENYTDYCNKDYDALLHVATLNMNENEKVVLYSNAIKIAQNDYINIPLFKYTYVRMVKPYVRNYKIDGNYLDHVQSKWLYLVN